MKQSGIVKNSVLNAIKVLSSFIFPLITVPYVARTLGAENLGKVTFSNSIIGYFALLASLGISTYAIRECGCVKDDRKKLEKMAGEIYSINIITMLVSYFALFVFVLFFSRLREYRVLLTILSFSICMPIFGTEWINLARGDYLYVTIRTIIIQVISLILLFVFVKGPDDYIKYAVVLAFSTGGAQFVNIFYVRRFCNISFTLSIDWKKHFKPVLLLFSLLIAQSIMANLDITMIGILKGDYYVGIYGMAVKMYVTIESVVSSIAIVLLPQLTLYFKTKEYLALNDALRKTWIYLYSMAIPLVVGMVCFSRELIVLFCGTEYAPAAVSFGILGIAMFVNLLGGSFWGNIVLLPAKREGQFMMACIWGAIGNIGLNMIFINMLGIEGAAIATVISFAIVYFLCRIRKDKEIKLGISAIDLCGPLIGGGLIAGLCFASKLLFETYALRLIICIPASAFLYYFVLKIFKNELILIGDEKIMSFYRRKHE